MLIHAMSDIHLEFDKDWGKKFVTSLDPTGVDVLVLAGDIIVANERIERYKAEAFSILCEKYPHVFFVPGNHDYYGSSPMEMHHTTNSLGIDNLEMLMPGDKATIGGKTFRGGSLWYPDPELADDYYKMLKRGWPDYNYINSFEPWVYTENANFRLKVSMAIQEGDIVISHMLPTWHSVHPQFKSADTNCFFVSDEEEFIRNKKPALWIHGHTHYPFDYKYGDTRVYCNPRGYPNENCNPNFLQRILIEV